MLGTRDDWDALVFPMKAIGRGVNIVFADGPRVRDAVIGTVAFFVRLTPPLTALLSRAAWRDNSPWHSTGPRFPPAQAVGT